MRRRILTLQLVVALGIFVYQVPLWRAVSALTGAEHTEHMAVPLMSQSAYGAKLGEVIDKVVKNIHARIPNAQITHADVLTILCMESAGLVGKRSVITSYAGARGLTQVMPRTLYQYAYSHAGGFYLPYRPDLLYRDPRYSIEAGALIFNHHLMKYVPRYGPAGGRRAAAIAYNGGPGRVGKRNLPRETYNYAFGKLPRCFNAVVHGRSPVRGAVWQAMVSKVSELTGGKMMGKVVGMPSSIASLAWAPESIDRTQALGRRWWSSPWGQAVSRGGGAPSTGAGYGSVGQGARERRQSLWQRLRSLTTPQDTYHNTSLTDRVVLSARLQCRSAGDVLRLRWVCPSQATVSRGHATGDVQFNTNGALVGSVSVRPAPGEYTVQCIGDHKVLAEAKCVVRDSERVTDITEGLKDSIPHGVVLSIEYDAGDIIWSTIGATRCIIESTNGMRGSGTEGRAHLPVVRNSAVVTLKCATDKGIAIKHRRIIQH